jgi:hypothetical protein
MPDTEEINRIADAIEANARCVDDVDKYGGETCGDAHTLHTAARLLRRLADLTELCEFLIDACADHRISVPINSRLLELAADIAAGTGPQEHHR